MITEEESSTERLIMNRRPGNTYLVNDPKSGSYYCHTYYGASICSYSFYMHRDGTWCMIARGLVVRDISNHNPFDKFEKNEEWIRAY